MKKFTSAFAALAMMGSAFAGAVAPAQAQAQTYTGTVDVFKGIDLNCTASITLTPATATTGTATVAIGAPEPTCAALNITSNPHSYSLVGGALTIAGMRVETVTLGNCFGDLHGTVTTNPDGSGSIAVDDVLPPETGTLPCYVSGTVYKPAP
ncbi:hypothetical protein FG91_03455 [Sphingopyxis sp. LC81]|uniref:hypothetical protein n=1 Tax=Sphingopyxis sp. LC81 TaxID=1502850 RepID=UPI00050F3646|nr:hypothetical protein [Sphingopyxis sp. LC81]KGB52708.1 hypothetical protein FG91_03455 [Sphingopyxis sp. LC81]